MPIPSSGLSDQYRATRQRTMKLCRNLTAEDMVAQSMPDASPAKWHLAHTTWFYETFILTAYAPSYRVFDERYAHLFNSYYVSAGSRYLRPQRGLLTQPSLSQIQDYRAYVDEHMVALLKQGDDSVSYLTTVGVHHEMQHQELMMTDILHLLAHNPLYPQVFDRSVPRSVASDLSMLSVDSTMTEVGAPEQGFSYDCEKPKHQAYLHSHALANRPVTNGEWLQFVDDKGYQEPLLWLSDGWSCKEENDWQTPLYWHQENGEWHQYGLDGMHPLDLNAPVCHVSYYEADAFAKWAGKRLPNEHELEHSTESYKIEGHFVENEWLRPVISSDSSTSLCQVYGDVWEWTQSAYSPYPKFKAEQGALGEYNGKFMANQFVLKGGSCATAQLQMRSSYRNFFYPHHRWQYSGLRLAEDV